VVAVLLEKSQWEGELILQTKALFSGTCRIIDATIFIHESKLNKVKGKHGERVLGLCVSKMDDVRQLLAPQKSSLCTLERNLLRQSMAAVSAIVSTAFVLQTLPLHQTAGVSGKLKNSRFWPECHNFIESKQPVAFVVDE
jgi:hypothetical protein